MAVFPSELKRVLDDLFHQLEGLLYPGLRQGREVHHAHVHLHWKQTHITAARVTLETTDLCTTQEEGFHESAPQTSASPSRGVEEAPFALR